MAVLRVSALLVLWFQLVCHYERFVMAQQCSPVDGQPGCVCDTGGDGNSGVINLTSIASTDTSNPTFSQVGGPKGYKYSYNPCFGFTDGDCSDVAGCQYAYGRTYSIGQEKTEAFQYDQDQNQLSLQYTGGADNRISIVWLYCDETADTPKLEALGEANKEYTYEFHLTTKCVCPGVCASATNSPTEGPSGPTEPDHSQYEPPVGYVGLVLIILSVAALATYFIVGAVVLKLKLNMTGLEMIPNKLFWKELPFLVKDGCVFVFKFTISAGQKVVGLFRGRAHGYSSI